MCLIFTKQLLTHEVGDAAVGGVLPVLEDVHLEVEVGVVQRHAVEVTEAVAESVLLAEARLGGVRAGRHPVDRNA